ncbi:putative membrane transporter protein [Sulfidibacter corallicola]|uniref:Probable membrane transporter protein n=1 Tax=Sulfidibacter corallicola TaxID=2818388 RepID=A0A8A4TW60_SULCO|nr:sulfite exporter TauE/SafE family protein [Sulfidibacter corallicola]QTD53411.1 sulfite exporter TauE/SafE family protein [Sulfidibacter corallicola]
MTLGLALSVLVGITLGLLGGGGSILTLPILLYAMHFEPHTAIAMSLFVVGTTSGIGAVQHARAGNVRWQTGLWFSAGGMAGAFSGGKIGVLIPGPILLLLFGGLMFVTAFAMLRGRRTPQPRNEGARHVGFILVEGFLVGGFTGMVGAGGGFLVVPALVLLGGIPMKEAVGTSLLVISLKSFAGLGGYLGQVDVNWQATLAVTAAAVMGSFAGTRLMRVISPDRLRTGFAWFVMAMAIYMLGRELPGLV